MNKYPTIKLFLWSLAIATLFGMPFSSCNKLDIAGMIVNRSDTEERVADWLEWDEQHDPIVIDSVPYSYTFYSCSDIHINDDNSRVARYITKERNDPSALFSIVAGDIANEKGDRPYQLFDAAMQYNPSVHAKNDPCFPILGNHDVYFDCASYFKTHYHTSTYSVVVRTIGGTQDLFLFLDSGNGTHGSMQMKWLEDHLCTRMLYRYVIVISHNWLFRTTYNYTTTPAANLPEDEQYAFMNLMSRWDVDMVIMGHFHYRDTKTFGGVPYVMTDNLNDGSTEPSYLVVRCGSELTYEYRNL